MSIEWEYGPLPISQKVVNYAVIVALVVKTQNKERGGITKGKLVREEGVEPTLTVK
jgi:hypothetical protein